MSECEHVLSDENGVCLDCGEPAPDTALRLGPEEVSFLNKFPKNQPMVMFPVPQKADIPGIVRLADLAIEEYAEQLERQKDPDNPNLPRMRIIGTTMYRPRWNDIWKQIIAKSYIGAVMLGYRQPIARWDAFLKETVQINLLRLSQ